MTINYGRGFSQVTVCCLEATSTIAYDQQRSSGGAVVGQSRGAGKAGSTKPHPHSLLPVPRYQRAQSSTPWKPITTAIKCEWPIKE
eukprot:COSAG01_NODE_805_length_13443_cov_81.464928_6_plen_86_part_00